MSANNSVPGGGKKATRRKSDKVQSSSKESRVQRKVLPFDISNGKTLFKKYECIEYNSQSHNAWLEVQVLMVREDGAIMIDLKDKYFFTVQEQKEKFRKGSRQPWQIDTELQYYSLTQGGWVDCTVTLLRDIDNAVQINIKAEYWMLEDEQEEKLRLPIYEVSDEVVWEVGKLLKMEPPQYKQGERRLEELLENEPDHTSALECLAALRRDHYGDYSGAEKLYRQALDENPFELKVLSDFGDLLKAMGNKSEGEQVHQRWRKVRDKVKDIEEETAG